MAKARPIKPRKTKPRKPVQARIFPVAGFGASAGGLEAFVQVLSHLPGDTGMAFVLVQHLDPKHGSMLGDLVARATSMPVSVAAHDMPVAPNQVYVIPPNSDLTIAGGLLRLRPRSTVRGLHLPIDHFFRSLAEDRGSMAIGVILSGTASDGTLGLKAIKAEGGIGIAQSEKSAKYAGMPGSAIAAGLVDYVLAPEGIARELTRIGRHPYVSHIQETAAGVLVPEGDDALSTLFSMLRNATGVDFTHYKHSTIRRRIARRMLVQKSDKLAGYLKFVQDHPDELQALYRDILINVTSFFRDPATFRAIQKTIFPRLLRGRTHGDPVRIWIPGSSTGEEAYSMAIALTETMRDLSLSVPVQVFATDISDVSIEKARAGFYPEGIARDVPPNLLRRYFTPVESGYQVSRALREMCVFARQNVVRDAPFSKLDLISCRNLLIYLAPVLQHRAINVFHYALKPGGFLWLGSSETIGQLSELFTVVDKKHKVYSKKGTGKRVNMDFPPAEAAGEVPGQPRGQSRETWTAGDVTREADRIVLGKYAPTGVIVNDDMKVLQFRGRTGKYLEPEPGEAC